MPTPLVLPSFAAGELSPALHGRVDIAKYQAGLATCLNWFIHPFGGASTRAGTSFVGEVLNHSNRSRLIPFQFNTQQTYVLEFGDQQMRVIMDGGYVLETGTNINVISNQSPPNVTTNAPHGLANGDAVWIDGVQGMVELNRRRFTATVVNITNLTLNSIDAINYGVDIVNTGTVSRIYTISTPYLVADLPLLKFVQSADTMTITHPLYAPRKLTRSGHAAWTLSTITFAPTQAAPTNFVSSSPGAGYNYAITAENDVTGEESRALGGTSNVLTSLLTWTAASGATAYNVYRSLNGIYGLIGRATASSGFQDNSTAPDISRTIPGAVSPFPGTSDWPGCSTYHDGRQWYARTDNNPQTLFASQSASFYNFDVSVPVGDSDAIRRTIASLQVNEIRFLLSFDILLAFTSGAVWRGWAGTQEDVITPANLGVKPVAYEGIAQIPPIASINEALYVAASGKRVRDFFANGDGFQSRDMSILSSHLFEGRVIEEWAYAKDPDGVVWCVRDDGALLSFTYLREHEVYAWARHETDGEVESVAAIQEDNVTVLYLSVKRTINGATKRYVERMLPRFFETVFDCWCVDSGYRYDGWNTDTTKTLTISGSTYNQGDTVTMTATGFSPFTIPHSFAADQQGKQYILRSGENQVTVTITARTSDTIVSATLDYAPHASLQATAISDWALATVSPNGLWHLEGEDVSVFADGNQFPDATVSNGTITLERAVGRVLVGLPYTCDLETLDIEAQPTLQGKQKNVNKVVVRLKDSRGLSVGPDSTRLVDIKERTTETQGYPTALTTGDEEVLIDPLWNSNGRVFIRQDHPLPATVVAIIPRLDAGA